jgi:hypothetical protein
MKKITNFVKNFLENLHIEIRLENPRKNAHCVFDHLWKDGYMKRSEAYTWLSKALRIEKKDCHISLFDSEMCQRAIELSREKLKELKGETPRLCLLRLGDLYLITEGCHGKDGDKSWQEYYFHEHQCSENIFRSVCAVFHKIQGGDPHGLVDYIADIESTPEVLEQLDDFYCEWDRPEVLKKLFKLFKTDGKDYDFDKKERTNERKEKRIHN